MTWLKLTRNGLYLMKSGDGCFLEKMIVSPTGRRPTEYRLNIPPSWFTRADAPRGMIVDLESAEPESCAIASSNALTGKRIILDPGHGEVERGVNDPGAIAPNGATERDLVRRQATLIKARLEAQGARVTLIENGTGMSLTQIGALGRGADCFVSLHLNVFNRQAQGHEVLIDSQGSAADERLARLINEELDREFEIQNRGIKRQGLAVLRGVPQSVPAVLTESFFIDSVNNGATLNAWIVRAADAIANGITRFLK